MGCGCWGRGSSGGKVDCDCKLNATEPIKIIGKDGNLTVELDCVKAAACIVEDRPDNLLKPDGGKLSLTCDDLKKAGCAGGTFTCDDLKSCFSTADDNLIKPDDNQGGKLAVTCADVVACVTGSLDALLGCGLEYVGGRLQVKVSGRSGNAVQCVSTGDPAEHGLFVPASTGGGLTCDDVASCQSVIDLDDRVTELEKPWTFGCGIKQTGRTVDLVLKPDGGLECDGDGLFVTSTGPAFTCADLTDCIAPPDEGQLLRPDPNKGGKWAVQCSDVIGCVQTGLEGLIDCGLETVSDEAGIKRLKVKLKKNGGLECDADGLAVKGGGTDPEPIACGLSRDGAALHVVTDPAGPITCDPDTGLTLNADKLGCGLAISDDGTISIKPSTKAGNQLTCFTNGDEAGLYVPPGDGGGGGITCDQVAGCVPVGDGIDPAKPDGKITVLPDPAGPITVTDKGVGLDCEKAADCITPYLPATKLEELDCGLSRDGGKLHVLTDPDGPVTCGAKGLSLDPSKLQQEPVGCGLERSAGVLDTKLDPDGGIVCEPGGKGLKINPATMPKEPIGCGLDRTTGKLAVKLAPDGPLTCDPDTGLTIDPAKLPEETLGCGLQRDATGLGVKISSLQGNGLQCITDPDKPDESGLFVPAGLDCDGVAACPAVTDLDDRVTVLEEKKFDCAELAACFAPPNEDQILRPDPNAGGKWGVSCTDVINCVTTHLDGLAGCGLVRDSDRLAVKLKDGGGLLCDPNDGLTIDTSKLPQPDPEKLGCGLDRTGGDLHVVVDPDGGVLCDPAKGLQINPDKIPQPVPEEIACGLTRDDGKLQVALDPASALTCTNGKLGLNPAKLPVGCGLARDEDTGRLMVHYDPASMDCQDGMLTVKPTAKEQLGCGLRRSGAGAASRIEVELSPQGGLACSGAVPGGLQVKTADCLRITQDNGIGISIDPAGGLKCTPQGLQIDPAQLGCGLAVEDGKLQVKLEEAGDAEVLFPWAVGKLSRPFTTNAQGDYEDVPFDLLASSPDITSSDGGFKVTKPGWYFVSRTFRAASTQKVPVMGTYTKPFPQGSWNPLYGVRGTYPGPRPDEAQEGAGEWNPNAALWTVDHHYSIAVAAGTTIKVTFDTLNGSTELVGGQCTIRYLGPASADDIANHESGLFLADGAGGA